MTNRYKVLGLMSGTSLDGLDIACVDFYWNKNKELLDQWSFKVYATKTYPYPNQLKSRLVNISQQSIFDFLCLDKDLGIFMGEKVQNLLNETPFKPQFIASHGHTIFHQPDKKLTTQIGHGEAIAAVTGLKVISNFRMLDVLVGGQGAPLVPLGDDYLFGSYRAVLNLGGIANISYRYKKKRIGFDICPCNMVLNELSERLGYPFDYNGEFAKTGKVDKILLNNLNQLPFYCLNPPKSLAREGVEKWVLEKLKGKNTKHLLATFNQHISDQITKVLNGIEDQKEQPKQLLITGGGAYNHFLIETLKQQNPNWKIILPLKEIIEFKEAIIFAFLGLCRLLEVKNCLSTVTGAKIDVIGGTISGLKTNL